MRWLSRMAWFIGGAITTVTGLIGLLAWRVQREMRWPPPHSDRTVGPVAISPTWSVVLEEKPSNPILAEYDYRLLVYASGDRDGQYRGTVNLVPNAGGRTYLCLYLLSAPRRLPLLQVDDRSETSIVDLVTARRIPNVPPDYHRQFLGAFVEEAYPLRFIPAAIESDCPANR
jgi:hypothetical protein